MKKALGRAFLRLGERLALGYDAGESMRIRKDLGWGRSTPRDEDAYVKDGSRETIRLKGSDLRRNNPIVAGVCNRLASFTVGTGIIPQARTESAEWNKAAEDYWMQWSKRCDARGRTTLWGLQWQAVSLRPTHGGIYLELLEDGTVRPIECERIRNPRDPKLAEAYTDGVLVDRMTGRVKSYRVHARDQYGTFGADHAERDVEAENIIPVVTPSWRPDQVREIPDLAPIVPALTDIGEMNTYTLNTAKVQSMIIGALKKIQGGGANIGQRTSGTPTVGQRQTFAVDWGKVMELFAGEDLELKTSPTPNTMHISYMKLQLMLAAAALDMPYEFFTLDFSTADFSRQKAVLLMVNKSIRNWQKWINEAMNQRLWNWIIAKAMNSGVLPKAPTVKNGNGFPVNQWFRVDWQPPEEAWTDRQESNQADMIEWQMGLGPLTAAAKRRGRDYEDSLNEKARIIKMAERIEKDNGLPAGSLIQAQIPGQTFTISAADSGKKKESPDE